MFKLSGKKRMRNLVCAARNAVARRGAKAAAGATVLSFLATKAHALGTLTVPAIDLTDFYAAAVVLLGALAAMWIAYKVIGFFKSK